MSSITLCSAHLLWFQGRYQNHNFKFNLSFKFLYYCYYCCSLLHYIANFWIQGLYGRVFHFPNQNCILFTVDIQSMTWDKRVYLYWGPTLHVALPGTWAHTVWFKKSLASHRLVGAKYATGDQWRNNSRKNEGMEPKQQQYPVVDVTGDGNTVWCHKE